MALKKCRMSRSYCPDKECKDSRHACTSCNGIGIVPYLDTYVACPHDGTHFNVTVTHKKADSGSVLGRAHNLKIIRKV